MMCGAITTMPGMLLAAVLMSALVAVALLSPLLSAGVRHPAADHATRRAAASPIDALKDRYARGEIDLPEFHRRLDRLLRDRDPFLPS